MIKAFAIGASLVTLAAAVPANAAFVLNTNGGNGSVDLTEDGFVLTGSANGSELPNFTTYTDTARADRTVRFNYTYTTQDSFGSNFDLAGFLVGSTFTLLSPFTLDGEDPVFGPVSGFREFSVSRGQTFGFYVQTVDNLDGPGVLEISQLAIPEPATWAFMILGFGFIGGAMRYSKRGTKVAFA